MNIKKIQLRRRLLGYRTFLLVLAFVTVASLSVINYRYDPRIGTAWHWTKTGLVLAAMAYFWNRVRRDRRELTLQLENLKK